MTIFNNYSAIVKSVSGLAREQGINPASQDRVRIGLLIIDALNSFSDQPYADLPVPGASGDYERLAAFVRNNLGRLTAIELVFDTHTPMQIFHPLFWIDPIGNPPAPLTEITHEDVTKGIWRINPEVGKVFGKSEKWLNAYALHYTKTLGKFTIWPYHALIGSPGHALDCQIEEAVLAYSLVRQTTPSITMKGTDPFTESFSAIKPEIMYAHDGSMVGKGNIELLRRLGDYHILVVAGEADSHCVPKTLEHVIHWTDNAVVDSALKTSAIYVLKDCTSPVPGFEKQADEAFESFATAGVHIVKSTIPMEEWPDIELN